MLKLLIHFLIGLLVSVFSIQAEKTLTHQEKQFFESKIRPIFAKHCYKCHSKDSEKLKGNLLLDSQAGWQTGGTHGSVITPFQPEDSRLMEAVQYQNKHLQMPPKEKLPHKEINLLTQWIKMGAPDPRTGDLDFVKNRSRIDILKSQKNYWAFKPLKQPKTPTVKNTSWSEKPLDKFILAKLENAGISPNAKLNKQKLIRRLYFDIIGLPPTPEKIEEYLNNKSPKATEELIDELLNNQHYGERWARHWMDVARFAESFGFEQDYNRPYAYFYRDFLIKAFNDDMPYNQFVQWQIAGDEIAPQEPMANMATGFLAAGVFPTQLTEAEFETARYDELDDVIGTVGTTFLGLTVSCARCHNHKYDPIPQSDYYRMAATFATSIRAIDHIKFPKDSPFLENAKKLAQKAATDFENYGEKQLEKAFLGYQKKNLKKVDKLKLSDPLKELFKKTYSTLNASEKQELITWYKTVDRKYKSLKEELELTEKNSQQSKARVMVMTEGLKNIPHHADGRGYPHFYKDVYHLKRGSPSNKEEIAKPGFLQVATHSSKTEKDWMTTPPKDWRTSYRRRAMAEWMTDEKHGAGQLVARVMVNRLWQHHFGQGIVKTPNDFGRQGEKPRHPELLDYLASKLIQNNWSLKSIHRLILNSETYQVDSQHHDKKQSIDPDNHLFWKQPLKRLEAEIIRDSMLSITQSLDPKLYGPGSMNANNKRRSIYFFLKRSQLIPMMRLFDMPSPLSGQGQRQVTTIAPQALLFINNEQVNQYSQLLAKRLNTPNSSDLDIIQNGYKITLGRSPNTHETKSSLAFLSQSDNRNQAISSFAKTLMSLNEFIYIE